jgi:hypothetical protein
MRELKINFRPILAVPVTLGAKPNQEQTLPLPKYPKKIQNTQKNGSRKTYSITDKPRAKSNQETTTTQSSSLNSSQKKEKT